MKPFFLISLALRVKYPSQRMDAKLTSQRDQKKIEDPNIPLKQAHSLGFDKLVWLDPLKNGGAKRFLVEKQIPAEFQGNFRSFAAAKAVQQHFLNESAAFSVALQAATQKIRVSGDEEESIQLFHAMLVLFLSYFSREKVFFRMVKIYRNHASLLRHKTKTIEQKTAATVHLLAAEEEQQPPRFPYTVVMVQGACMEQVQAGVAEIFSIEQPSVSISSFTDFGPFHKLPDAEGISKANREFGVKRTIPAKYQENFDHLKQPQHRDLIARMSKVTELLVADDMTVQMRGTEENKQYVKDADILIILFLMHFRTDNPYWTAMVGRSKGKKNKGLQKNDEVKKLIADQGSSAEVLYEKGLNSAFIRSKVKEDLPHDPAAFLATLLEPLQLINLVPANSLSKGG